MLVSDFSDSLNVIIALILSGLPLSHLESDMTSFGEESCQLGLVPTIQAQFTILRLTALKLMGKVGDHEAVHTGDWIDEEMLL